MRVWMKNKPQYLLFIGQCQLKWNGKAYAINFLTYNEMLSNKSQHRQWPSLAE